jgi:hypothetical protein
MKSLGNQLSLSEEPLVLASAFPILLDTVLFLFLGSWIIVLLKSSSVKRLIYHICHKQHQFRCIYRNGTRRTPKREKKKKISEFNWS